MLDNKAVARRVREEIWNKRNFGLADEIVVADCAHQVHDPLTPPLGRGPDEGLEDPGGCLITTSSFSPGGHYGTP